MCIANIRNYCANDHVYKVSNVELKTGVVDLTETAFPLHSGTSFANFYVIKSVPYAGKSLIIGLIRRAIFHRVCY